MSNSLLTVLGYLSTITTEMEQVRTSFTRTSRTVCNPFSMINDLFLRYIDTPNTLNGGFPAQANRTAGRGFFTSPGRQSSGSLVRALPSSFDYHWTQPRLFYNSLTATEQQFLINAIRFEASHVKSKAVKENVLTQLNRVSHDIAVRVAEALATTAPAPDPTFYHDNKTAFVSILNNTLPTVATLQVAVLATTNSSSSISDAGALKARFGDDGVEVTVVGESLIDGVDQTYSAADATSFDGIVVAAGAEELFISSSASTLYPLGRPNQILLDGYRWGKPVGALGSATAALESVGIGETPGVFANSTDVEGFVSSFETGLKTFKFVDRFPVDP